MATIRIQNIPSNTDQDKFLQDVLGCSPAAVLASSLEVSPDNSTKMTGTVTLPNTSEVPRLLKLDNTSPTGPFRVASRLAVDNHFRGFTVVAGGTNSELDIIAIHGLDGHAFNSWTANGVMWLRDLLPEQVPDARVLLYGYNANLVKDASRSRIKEHARLFIKSMQGLEEIQKRRIIFVCHSLGGLVLKQALIFIRNETEYSVLRDVALGVIFLGTPHRGSPHANLARILVNIARISFRVNAKQLLSTLEKDSSDLMDLAHSFKELHSKLRLASFCEQLPMKLPGKFLTSVDLGLIVDQWSATLDVEGESIIPVDRDHVTIAKYGGAGDEVYKLVVNQVKDMTKGIVISAPPKTQKNLDTSTPNQLKVPTDTSSDRSDTHPSSSRSSSRMPPPSSIDVVSEKFTEVDSADLRTSSTPSPSPQPEAINYAYRIQFKIVDETGQDFHVIDRSGSEAWEVMSHTDFKLKMGGSGTSGSLLLSSSKSSESFSVAAGIHNYSPWCDILVDVPANAVSQLITDSYYQSRSGRLWATSVKEEKTSARGTIVSLTISDLQWDGDRIATVLIRSGGQISTPPEEEIPLELDIPPAPDYQYRILFHIVDRTTDRFRVAAKNLLEPHKDLWETFPPTLLRLCMSHSGKSATLLFEDGSSLERFSIAVGMHNYNPWCDIITDLPAEVKLSILNKTYYESRSGRLWANSTREEKVSLRGTKVLLNISDLQWDGSYMVTITISNP